MKLTIKAEELWPLIKAEELAELERQQRRVPVKMNGTYVGTATFGPGEKLEIEISSTLINRDLLDIIEAGHTDSISIGPTKKV